MLCFIHKEKDKNIKQNILISIIIPLYNKEQYFERCFNSVANQAYKNIECIIIEDCSTDNSLELAENLINNYTGIIKFTLIKHKQNGGLSAARNTGINNCNGEYIYFLDSDDEITENCISSLVTLVEKYPGVEIVQGNSYQCPRVENDQYELKEKLSEYINDNLNIKRNYYNKIPVNAVNKLIKKYFIIKHSLYFKENIIHEDYHWYFFAIKILKSFAFSNEYCYIRYIVPDSIMTDKNLYKSIYSYLIINDDKLNNLDIDVLEQSLKIIRKSLNNQKSRILSNEEYKSLMPYCLSLINRLPGFKQYFILTLKALKNKIFKRK